MPYIGSRIEFSFEDFGSAPVHLALSTVTANNIRVQVVNAGTFVAPGTNMSRENTTSNVQTLTEGTATTMQGN
jgi:hypothetical protein